MPTKLFAALAILVAGCVDDAHAFASPAHMRVTITKPAQRTIYLADAAISQDQAAEIAKKSTGGKVLGVRISSNAGNQKTYEVKVLSADGRVIVVRIDGQTGSIL